jgi:hypothetical protein
MKTTGTFPMDDEAVILADSGAGDRRFAFLLFAGAVACLTCGVRYEHQPLVLLGVAMLAGAAVMFIRRRWSRKSVIFDRRGLCAVRNGRIEGMIPADAIREVILAEKASGSLELRLTFDNSAVPVLPPAIREFDGHWKRRRDLFYPPAEEAIILGRVGSDPSALTLQKAFQVHRLVEDAGIGDWRRISEP